MKLRGCCIGRSWKKWRVEFGFSVIKTDLQMHEIFLELIKVNYENVGFLLPF